MVSGAGAAVYSASDVAHAEFPDLDVSIRRAVSIARRLQDPLAELVKIDPQSIGVGLYQHDVDQKKLAAALDAVVESVVNYVGINVNTAWAALLGYVAGISKRLAAAIVEHRETNGPFGSHAELKKVKGLGPKAFEQAAGFLRVPGSRNPLNNTTMQPESYEATKRARSGRPEHADGGSAESIAGVFRGKWVDDRRRTTDGETKDEGPKTKHTMRNTQIRNASKWSTTTALLGIGELTLRDIVEALIRPATIPTTACRPSSSAATC